MIHCSFSHRYVQIRSWSWFISFCSWVRFCRYIRAILNQTFSPRQNRRPSNEIKRRRQSQEIVRSLLLLLFLPSYSYLLLQSITSYGDRPNDLETVLQYFRAHFLQAHRKNNEKKRVLYTHFTSAINTKTTQSIITNGTSFPRQSHWFVNESWIHRSSWFHFPRILTICCPRLNKSSFCHQLHATISIRKRRHFS